jgi:hypothetical protein
MYSVNFEELSRQIKLSASLMGSLYPCMMDWMLGVLMLKAVLGAAVMHDPN